MFRRITVSNRLLWLILLAVIMEPLSTFGIDILDTTRSTSTVYPTSITTINDSKKPPIPQPSDLVTYNCLSSAEDRHQKKIIRLGVILPFEGPHEYVMKKVRPAVEFATDYILQETNMLQNYTIEFDYRDSKCSEVKGPLEAIDLYTTKSADVFIGPACDYAVAPIARFSPHWGIPILSAGALVHSFGEKSQYKLLTRLMGPYTKAGEFLLSVLRAYDYRTVGMMLHSNEDESQRKTDCWFTLEALFLVMKKLDLEMDLKDVEFFDENRPTNFEQNLKALSQKFRGMWQ